jgi:hypothetical protein
MPAHYHTSAKSHRYPEHPCSIGSCSTTFELCGCGATRINMEITSYADGRAHTDFVLGCWMEPPEFSADRVAVL